MTNLLKRFCPHGHEMIITLYTWQHFLFHRCRVCKAMYNYNEITKEPPSGVSA